MHEDWFKTWFDSPYYPLLYAHRDNNEADTFVQNINNALQLPPAARILDLACGQGRHSRALGALGYTVTGADLSRSSIEKAKPFETEQLSFVVHDMRRPVAINYFDAVLNLFTSFGYFESIRDNVRTIDAVHSSLRDKGHFLIDYFNAEQVKKAVAGHASGIVDIQGIHFVWEKSIEGNKVIKRIKVNDNGTEHRFMESVALFGLNDFTAMLGEKFEIVKTFGDYHLSQFDVNTSPRLILACRKK
jgi:SAM-dependent methyltransferase